MRSTSLIIWLGVSVLSAFVFHVALSHDMWREFFVSEFQLLATAVTLSIVLKE